MAESPSLINSLNSKRLNELRVSQLQSSSSGVHRSQTVPNQGHPPPKLASRSHTMPMVGEGTVRNSSPLKLGSLSQATTTQDHTVDLTVDSQPHTEKSFNPVRRAPSGRSIAPKATCAADNSDHSHLLVIWLICCCACLILAPTISVILGFTLHTPEFAYNSTQPDLPGRTVQVGISLVSADPLQSVATFDWQIYPEVNGYCTVTAIENGECTDVNIFMDSNLFAGNVNTLQQSNEVPTTPLFKMNATTMFTHDPRANTLLFRTNILMVSRAGKKAGQSSSLVHYPFDVYIAEIFMFAEDTNNQSVSLKISNNGGNAVGFDTSATNCPREDDIPLGMVCMVVTIKRGNLVKAFSVIVIIAVWLITIILLLLTFTSIIFGFRQRTEVLIVPVATIFAFTQLRSSMPGAPAGFGDILDFVGLLPCLGILAFSAAVSLGAFILQDPEERSEVLTWGRIRREYILLRKRWAAGKESDADGESEFSNGGA